MEVRRGWQGWWKGISASLPRRHLSRKFAMSRQLHDPVINVTIVERRRVYHPGEKLVCEYSIEVAKPDEIQAVEASVLWYTEGKGEEDMTVHYFDRRGPDEAHEGDLRHPFRFETVLPKSPLSYRGIILKIHWCARVRAFLRNGDELHREQVFQLGDVPRSRRVLL